MKKVRTIEAPERSEQTGKIQVAASVLAMQSPALSAQTADYPPEWQGRVPLQIQLADGIDWIGGHLGDFNAGKTYYCIVQSTGFLQAITNEGNPVYLRKEEYKVVRWHLPQLNKLKVAGKKTSVPKKKHTH